MHADIHARRHPHTQTSRHAHRHPRTQTRTHAVSLCIHARTPSNCIHARRQTFVLYISPQTQDFVAKCTSTMEKIISKNEKIYLIYGGQKFRKDSDLAGGGAAWRGVKPACRGRMKISVEDEVLSSTNHNHARTPSPCINARRQTSVLYISPQTQDFVAK